MVQVQILKAMNSVRPVYMNRVSIITYRMKHLVWTSRLEVAELSPVAMLTRLG